LASAYGILQNHGGAIQAFSEKGHGATFCFYLPATDAVPETETRRATSPASGQGTILLVDDEPLILDVAAAMLAKLGYKVLRAESGAAALDIFSREQARIDAVVLDMIMPGMGGGATFDRLKAIDPNVRVLLASGYSLNGQASEIIDRGCTGFIQKPFNLAEFSEKLKAVLAPDDPG
jgi:CheY-like chemotaxis protein